MKTTFAAALILALTLGACAKQDGAKTSDQQTASATGTIFDPNKQVTVTLDGEPVTVAGVTFVAPSTWTSHGASGMRFADYSFGPVEGDKDSATMVVFYFGPQGGGGVEANIERWIGQMALADGADPHTVAKKLDFDTPDGLKAHLVEVAGIYNAGSMGGMGAAAGPREGYRMAGVVLEAPGGNLFFKLTGPEKTADQMIAGLQALVMGAKKAPAQG